MDSTRQTVANRPEPSLELDPPAAAVTLPQEATGDSDESDADVSVGTAGRSSETDEDDDDDAESCSGGFISGGCFIDIARDGECEDEFEDDVTMEVDMSEVDSKMAVPLLHRTGEYPAKGDGGRAPAVAAEGWRKLAGGGHAAAESNRLFWEACIAHGY